MIKINSKGKITKGKYSGWYIFIEPYGNQNGYLILIAENSASWEESATQNSKMAGYDLFARDYELLEATIEHNGWEIEWFSSPQ